MGRWHIGPEQQKIIGSSKISLKRATEIRLRRTHGPAPPLQVALECPTSPGAAALVTEAALRVTTTPSAELPESKMGGKPGSAFDLER